ncbi:MAG: hypothetical protein PHV68_03880 [Candidatus Gastranaerophilales bacterium]|nr:hypothetical protein [Candidatus Gastranaerophilales bacterium]
MINNLLSVNKNNNLSNNSNPSIQPKQPFLSKLERTPQKDYLSFGAAKNTIKPEIKDAITALGGNPNDISRNATEAITNLKLTPKDRQILRLISELNNNEHFNTMLEAINSNSAASGTRNVNNLFLLGSVNEHLDPVRNQIANFTYTIIDQIEKGEMNAIDTILIFNKDKESINPIDEWLKSKKGIANTEELDTVEKFEIVSKALKNNKKLLTYQLYDQCCKSYFNSNELNGYLKKVSTANIKNNTEVLADIEENCLNGCKNFGIIKKIVTKNNENSRERKVNNMLLESMNELLIKHYDDGENEIKQLVDNMNVSSLTEILKPSDPNEYEYDKEMSKIFKKHLDSSTKKNQRPTDMVKSLRQSIKKGEDPAYLLTVSYFEQMVPKVMDAHFENMIDFLPTRYKQLSELL